MKRYTKTARDQISRFAGVYRRYVYEKATYIPKYLKMSKNAGLGVSRVISEFDCQDDLVLMWIALIILSFYHGSHGSVPTSRREGFTKISG